jgi:hypothetical protein
VANSTVHKFVAPRGREMEYLIEQYQKAHPDEDASRIEPHRIADWACARGMWKKPPVPQEERLRRELARFLRGEYTLDPQGRNVRKHHAIIYIDQTPDGPKKRSRWFEIYEAPAKHMQASLALRRRSALADVVQLNLDLESYNENNVRHETVPPMDFDFNKDLEEITLPTHYPVEGPETDEDGEEV